MTVNAAFFCNNAEALNRVFRSPQRARVARLCRLHPETITSDTLHERLPELESVELVFSTWGMPLLEEAVLDRLPNLRAVFYAAGSVKGFAPPLLERGITVVSAWGANAIPVAEFTLAQIVLANKGFYRNSRACATPDGRRKAFMGRGNYGATVALLGAGMIGRALIERLRPFRLKVIVYDPFLSAADADRLGVELVGLADAFSRGAVVSNHIANVPETRGMLRGEHFAHMPQDAVFINTGRGATVREAELIDVLRHRPDLTALLDVTDPEPPSDDSPLYTLPNVLMTSHIAGSIGDEVVRMAETVMDECEAWLAGRPLQFSVSADMLDRMA